MTGSSSGSSTPLTVTLQANKLSSEAKQQLSHAAAAAANAASSAAATASQSAQFGNRTGRQAVSARVEGDAAAVRFVGL